MEIEGTVQSIIYRNSENGWTVLELRMDTDSGIDKLSVVGVLPLTNAGERVTLEGQFVTHPKYGRQFKAQSCRTLAPATLSAVEGYLGSGLIKGVGESTARAIVQTFGMDTLEILDNTPERLLEIPGIGKKRCAMIVASYQENRSMQSLLLSLEPYGITVNQAFRLYKIYGETCLARIEENPYQIIQDVDGIGFITADRIAQNVAGFSADSVSRLSAGLTYALNQARQEYGHTYLPRQSLLDYAGKLLGVDEVSLSDALDRLIDNGEAVSQELDGVEAVFTPSLHRMELSIAERLLALSEKPIDNPFFRFTAMQVKTGIELSHQQSDAVKAALEEGVLVITGGPGTGKTTIIRFITEIMEALELEVALAAPTGRAAKRMSEATGHEALTLHRLLEYVPGEGFQRNAENPLFFDMIIVDEMSMVDVPLMSALLKAIPAGTRLILVGDSDQLPPVGPGDVLRDILASNTVRVMRLTEIFRQAQKSLIITNAHRINEGRMPILDQPDSDFRFESILSQDQVLERVLALCSHPEPVLRTKEPLLELQVLAPMKKGTLGVHNLNVRLQAVMNPPAPDKREHVSGDTLFREGDRVMQIRNDYKIEWKRRTAALDSADGTGAFNGDLGTVYRIDPATQRMQILFDDDRLAYYTFTQLEELDLAYCISIHKSQGSEFPIVVLPLAGAAMPLLTRNLLYTAVTRAKKQVCCIGRLDAISAMVQNNRTTRRYTALQRRLIDWKALSR